MLTTGGNANAIFPAFWQLVKRVPVPTVYTVRFHHQQCESIHFRSKQCGREGVFFSTTGRVWTWGCRYSFPQLKVRRKGVSLSTTSRVRMWQVSLSSQKCKCGVQRLLVFGPWWFLTVWKLWNSIFQLLIHYFTLHTIIINELFAQHGKNKYKRNKEWIQ